MLALIDGILEDQRSRAEHYSTLMSTHRKFKTDCIGILMGYLQSSGADSEVQRQSREMAANALAIIICHHEYEQCEKPAKDFMNWLMHEDAEGRAYVRERCRTACILHLCKINELARIFVEERRGFNLIATLLKRECTKNDQLAYQVITLCWVLSFNQFALPHFADYSLGVIELVSKVLDFYNKEKIVRVVCRLFDVSFLTLPCVETQRRSRVS